MKTVFLIAFLALLMVLPGPTEAKKDKEVKMVAQVLAPFLPVYREKRPESEIITQVKKGDRLVVAMKGEYWARVYVPPNNELGWVELGMEEKKVDIVPESDKSYILMTFVFPILLLASIGVIIYLLRLYFSLKHKRALENASSGQV
jgi:hypothetical protein